MLKYALGFCYGAAIVWAVAAVVYVARRLG